VQGFERLREMENQLGTSVGNYSLDRTSSDILQHPVALDEPGGISARGELPIVHW
jgi:hypothetical protein